MRVLQVIGLVGSSRKRTLMLWQAVELSRVMDRPNLATLQIARKALEPPDDPLEQVNLLQATLVGIFMTLILFKWDRHNNFQNRRFTAVSYMFLQDATHTLALAFIAGGAVCVKSLITWSTNAANVCSWLCLGVRCCTC